MWTVMPSTTVSAAHKFFSFDELNSLGKVLSDVTVIKGRIWAGDERTQAWAIEIENFKSFGETLQKMPGRIEFMAYDEMILDEDTVHLVQEDLHRYAEDEGIASELVTKAVAALRGHETELYAVMAYAFLTSGRVVFVRAQNELARFVFTPSKLLSTEGISSVRKLQPLMDA